MVKFSKSKKYVLDKAKGGVRRWKLRERKKKGGKGMIKRMIYGKLVSMPRETIVADRDTMRVIYPNKYKAYYIAVSALDKTRVSEIRKPQTFRGRRIPGSSYIRFRKTLPLKLI